MFKISHKWFYDYFECILDNYDNFYLLLLKFVTVDKDVSFKMNYMSMSSWFML